MLIRVSGRFKAAATTSRLSESAPASRRLRPGHAYPSQPLLRGGCAAVSSIRVRRCFELVRPIRVSLRGCFEAAAPCHGNLSQIARPPLRGGCAGDTPVRVSGSFEAAAPPSRLSESAAVSRRQRRRQDYPSQPPLRGCCDPVTPVRVSRRFEVAAPSFSLSE